MDLNITNADVYNKINECGIKFCSAWLKEEDSRENKPSDRSYLRCVENVQKELKFEEEYE